MLLAGLSGLGAEVAKNLILAGVKGLTLLDHEQVHIVSAHCRLQRGFGLQFKSRNLCFQLSTKHLSDILIAHRNNEVVD